MKLFTREELLPLARRQPEVLVDMFLALQQRLVELEQRVKELEGQVARNSSNSGQPPSSARQSGLSGAEKALKQPQGRARFPFPIYRPGNRKRETKRPGGLVFGDLPAISPEDILCKVMPTEEQARPQYMPSDPSDPSGGFQNSLQRPL
jgi:hypothetical protein